VDEKEQHLTFFMINYYLYHLEMINNAFQENTRGGMKSNRHLPLRLTYVPCSSLLVKITSHPKLSKALVVLTHVAWSNAEVKLPGNIHRIVRDLCSWLAYIYY
jgi:hypothetical protein